MKQIIATTILSLSLAIAFGQKHDNIWININPGIDTTGSSPLDPPFPTMYYDFQTSPPSVTYTTSPYPTDREALLLCNDLGTPLWFTNGYRIFHFEGNVMENGDSINPKPLPNLYLFGYPSELFFMAIPRPDHQGSYYLIHCQLDWDGIWWLRPDLLLTQIDQAFDRNSGRVAFKNKPLISGAYWLEYHQATKHANGRDWWIVLSDADFPTGTRTFYSFLAGPDSVTLTNTQVIESYGPVPERGLGGLLQRNFTPDGKYLLSLDVRDTLGGVKILPFNRCSGAFGAPVNIPFYPGHWGGGGICASLDSRFLYVSNTQVVLQYDLTAPDIAASMDTVAVYDGYFDSGGPAIFHRMFPGPDGKIYFANFNMVWQHYIAKPNKKGKACQVVQRGFGLSFPKTQVPNYPNYRLGPIDGSACDTLGLNNEPLADFWWFADSTLTVEFADNSSYEPALWHWDFGDGAGMSSDTNPIYTFPAAGVYTVCLTVSNQYAADTICKMVTVGVTATQTTGETDEAPALLVFPNPAGAYFTLRYHWSYPDGRVSLFDAMGRLVQALRLPVQNAEIRYDTQYLPPGMYFLKMESPGTAQALWKKVVVER